METEAISSFKANWYKLVFFPIMVGILDRGNDIVIIVHGPSHGIQAIACPYLQIFCDRAGK